MTIHFTLDSSLTKKLLKLSDCQLMHARERGELPHIKQGNSFKYVFQDPELLLQLPLCQKIINWYQDRHPFDGDNSPKDSETRFAIIRFATELLYPLEKKFGDITVTYGFVSAELNRYVQRHSPEGTYPSLDQHSSHEVNLKQSRISKRDGIACDFTVSGYEGNMNDIVSYIVNSIPFDKIYYYGRDRPVHVSISSHMQCHLQIMNVSQNGRRIPGKKAFGDNALKLVQEL